MGNVTIYQKCQFISTFLIFMDRFRNIIDLFQYKSKFSIQSGHGFIDLESDYKFGSKNLIKSRCDHNISRLVNLDQLDHLSLIFSKQPNTTLSFSYVYVDVGLFGWVTGSMYLPVKCLFS